jgi:hypothetical protein
MKKPPTFDEFVKPKARGQRQDPEQLRAMFRALAAAWNAEGYTH